MIQGKTNALFETFKTYLLRMQGIYICVTGEKFAGWRTGNPPSPKIVTMETNFDLWVGINCHLVFHDNDKLLILLYSLRCPKLYTQGRVGDDQALQQCVHR